MASATLSKPRQDSTPLQRLRAVDASTWAKLAFAVLCAVALFGYFAFPTYPTYDSFYALLWGRDLLHLHLPDFQVYRGPTEHPLAIAFGMFCSIFGQGGARLMVFGSIASFVALVAGIYRLARLCFGPVVGMFAALLMLSRFYDENLAAQGYLDLSYVALIVWAVALEVQRPRRGTAVFLVLAAAGLLRPDAWVLSGVYWLWCAWPRGARQSPHAAPPSEAPAIDNRRRLLYLGLALIAPVVWVCVDTVVTGNPLYSLQSTAGLAEELGRSQGLSGVVASVWTYGWACSSPRALSARR
jgi:Dolichyl-phosphate-mannose-protein mannosyltransferase